MLERFADGELTTDQASDPDRVFPSDQVEWRLAEFAAFRRPIADVLGYEEIDAMVARVSVTDDRGRPMMVRVVRSSPPTPTRSTSCTRQPGQRRSSTGSIPGFTPITRVAGSCRP